jgi:hypothetical protein
VSFVSESANIRKNDWRKIMNTTNKYLQFDDPTILTFEFNVNEQFDFDSDFDDVDISTLVEMPDELEINWQEPVPVYLSVFINPDDSDAPYKINMKILAFFKVDRAVPESEAYQILQTEAASILLSYLRPMASMMVTASGFPPMTIPMLDFSDDDDD